MESVRKEYAVVLLYLYLFSVLHGAVSTVPFSQFYPGNLSS